MVEVRRVGWHRDPFGIHHERFYFADEQPGRLVRDEHLRESFDDIPENGLAPNRPPSRTVDAGRLRVIADEHPLPLPDNVAGEPWPIGSDDSGLQPYSLDHSGQWIDPPSHGWINRFHELTLPSRRARYALGLSLLVVVVVVVLLATTGGRAPTLPHSATAPHHGSGTSVSTVISPTTVPLHGWQVSESFLSSSLGLNSLVCPSTISCTSVGETTLKTGMVLHSDDGGTSWVQNALPNGIVPLNSVSCPTMHECTAVGGFEVISTQDGGTSWSVQFLKAQNLSAVSCPSVTMCVVAGVYPSAGPGCDDGVTYTTTDSGQTWTQQFLSCFTPRGLSCPTTSVCILVGTTYPGHYQHGEIFRSSGGSAWHDEFNLRGLNSQVNSVSCPSASFCEAVGDSSSQAALGSVDGGLSWASQHVGQNGSFTSLSAVTCRSTSICQAAGVHAFSTANGGANWTAQSIPATVSNMNGISCPSSGTCLSVGDGWGGLGVALRFYS
jgi:photosystem II stability/assembly factor-like uncharacterized protein